MGLGRATCNIHGKNARHYRKYHPLKRKECDGGQMKTQTYEDEQSPFLSFPILKRDKNRKGGEQLIRECIQWLSNIKPYKCIKQGINSGKKLLVKFCKHLFHRFDISQFIMWSTCIQILQIKLALVVGGL